MEALISRCNPARRICRDVTAASCLEKPILLAQRLHLLLSHSAVLLSLRHGVLQGIHSLSPQEHLRCVFQSTVSPWGCLFLVSLDVEILAIKSVLHSGWSCISFCGTLSYQVLSLQCVASHSTSLKFKESSKRRWFITQKLLTRNLEVIFNPLQNILLTKLVSFVPIVCQHLNKFFNFLHYVKMQVQNRHDTGFPEKYLEQQLSQVSNQHSLVVIFEN